MIQHASRCSPVMLARLPIEVACMQRSRWPDAVPVDGVGGKTHPHLQGTGRTVRCHPGRGVHRSLPLPLSIPHPLSQSTPQPSFSLPQHPSQSGVESWRRCRYPGAAERDSLDERRFGVMDRIQKSKAQHQRARSFNLYMGGQAGAASTVARLYGFRDHALSLQN
jgi:hypothetical protein